MSPRSSRVLVALFVMAGCFGQSSKAERHVSQLVEHWLWKQYWYGASELGTRYRTGQEFQALAFWRADEKPPSVGFCSTELGICQFYPDTTTIGASFEAKMALREDAQSAFRRFLRDSFGQNASSLVNLPEPSASDYVAETVKIVLPAITAPEAIRARRVRPPAETDALSAALSCLPDQSGCKVHLLIPFYSENDPWIPVYRECSRCPNTKPMIIFMRRIEGTWWHGARDFDDGPDFVRRTRRRIEEALMVEVNR